MKRKLTGDAEDSPVRRVQLQDAEGLVLGPLLQTLVKGELHPRSHKHLECHSPQHSLVTISDTSGQSVSACRRVFSLRCFRVEDGCCCLVWQLKQQKQRVALWPSPRSTPLVS